jgi:uroporphyrinogen decarboxylase
METYAECGTSERGNRIVNDIWGSVIELTEQSFQEIKRPIPSISLIETYQFPCIDDFGYENIKMWIDEGSFFVAAQIDTGYFKANQFFGLENYMEYIYTEPAKLHRFMERFTDFQIKLSDRLIDMGVDGIWLSDDHAYNSGPFMSPKMLQEFDFDYMKAIVKHVHERGLPVILHSCGNLNYTIDQLVDTGINALHAIQPSAGNDIFEYKKRFGDRLCLIGNLDINYLLPEGSPNDIADKVAEMADKMFFDKRGFVLSTCNLLNNDVPIENAITMHLSADRY